MSNFFDMKKGDLSYLISILLFAFVAFLPWSHHIEVAGMVLFGWLLALLMVFSPTIAFIHLLLDRKEKNNKGKNS